jgi:hypothetical protein
MSSACRGVLFLFLLAKVIGAGSLMAQMPFYTDDPDVTERGTLHFEFFNEHDALQSSLFPDLRQNTANFKANYGLGRGLELDIDVPYISIYHAQDQQASTGIGDTNMGVKWNFRKASTSLRAPALAASFYVELPTGDPARELGSGVADYALNTIAQEPLTDKTRITANIGFLFAGNTSTGAIGLQTTRGHVFTSGLSLLHDFSPRLTLGTEIYAALSDNDGLHKGQIQGLAGGQFALTKTFGFAFALLGGGDVASPRIGGQAGFEVDLPAFLHRATVKRSQTSPPDSPAPR